MAQSLYDNIIKHRQRKKWHQRHEASFYYESTTKNFVSLTHTGSRNQWTSMTPTSMSSKSGWPRSSKGPKGLDALRNINSNHMMRGVGPGHSEAKLLVGAAFSAEVDIVLMIHLANDDNESISQWLGKLALKWLTTGRESILYDDFV